MTIFFNIIIVLFLIGIVYMIFDMPKYIAKAIHPQYVKLKGKVFKKRD